MIFLLRLGFLLKTNSKTNTNNLKTMALTIRGRVVATPPPTSSEYNGRAFAKQFVVVEYGDMQPTNAAFEFDPDRNTEAASARVGEEVEVTFYPVSQESKNSAGVYFSNLRLFRINFLSHRSASITPAPQASSALAAEAKASEPVAQTTAESNANDDLPF